MSDSDTVTSSDGYISRQRRRLGLGDDGVIVCKDVDLQVGKAGQNDGGKVDDATELFYHVGRIKAVCNPSQTEKGHRRPLEISVPERTKDRPDRHPEVVFDADHSPTDGNSFHQSHKSRNCTIRLCPIWGRFS